MSKIKPIKISEHNKQIHGYYALIAKACGCTRSYVRQVLNSNMGTYHGKKYTDRNTKLVNQIRAKAKELEMFLESKTNSDV
jgi:hypothetical protein